MPPTLYLIDGHALAYRTYFALTSGSTQTRWQTSTGEPTAGVFGFTSVLLRILEQEKFDYLAVAFDPGRTFRHDIYADYKATRAKMPDDLRPQIKRIQEVLEAFNIPSLEIENYEADDVLGSLAYKAVALGLGVKIITGDRDLLQLVSDRVIVNLPGKSLAEAKDYYPEDVERLLGVRPDQIVDMKALVGDSSDNIPGVNGIGEKTAVSLLKTYGTLENIYNNLDMLSPSLRAKLEAGRESAFLSQRLARIVTDLDVSLNLEAARPGRQDIAKIQEVFRQLQFNTLLKRFQAWQAGTSFQSVNSGQQLSLFATAQSESVKVEDGWSEASRKLETGQITISSTEPAIEVKIVDSAEALASLAAQLKAAKQIAFDTETTSTDQMLAQLVGISLAIEPGRGFYIPIGHTVAALGEGKNNLPLSAVIAAIGAPLKDANIPKLGHNLKYDYIVAVRQGLQIAPLSFDTMIAEWLTNPDSHNLGLKKLAWVRLDRQMTEIESLIGKGKDQRSMAEVPLATVAAYAAADAEVILHLMPLLRDEMEQRGCLKLFEEIEMPLISVLAEMEMNGISLDTDFLKKMSVELQTRMTEIENRIYHQVGMRFNLNSTQQLSRALFDKLGLKPPDRTRRTTGGFYSTSAEVLENMRGDHEVIDELLEYRELSKLKSTYVDALPQQVNPFTGRVHTSYSQTGSVTGRLASSNPNLQNIPIRSELGRQVRRAFIAEKGYCLLSVDYSQVELRLAAHMAQDEAMLSAFRAGQDIHAATAAAIYGIPIEQVTPEQRRHAKAINFGLIYGMSAFGLTRSSDLTLAEAENFVSTYFKQFPGVKRYLEGVLQQAAQRGYVETLLGRRRYFNTIRFKADYGSLNREEREAINAPIQGTAADIMKIAMNRLPQALRRAGLTARLLLQVHDELVLEVPLDQIKETAALVRQVMEQAYPLSIPLKTEARYGENWGEMVSLD